MTIHSRYPINVTGDKPAAFNAFPSICHANDGRIWVAWVRFEVEDGLDSICLRYIEPSFTSNSLSPIWTVSEESGENFWPKVTALPDGDIVVTWSKRQNGHWCIFRRMLRGDVLTDEHVISDERGGWYPTCTLDADDTLWVAWIERLSHDVLLCKRDDRSSSPLLISQGGSCCRPTLLALDDGMLIAWDQFEDGRYQIRARVVHHDGSMSTTWTVSHGAEWQWQPKLGRSHDGAPLCCWVAQTDVRDWRGSIDQWDSVRCAHFDSTSWTPLGDDDVGTVVDLVHGLLAKKEDDRLGGYNGRRRYPFLRNDADGNAWVLWERKVQHEGKFGPGHLLGRCLTERGWGPVLEVARNFAFYEVEDRQPDAPGILWAAMRVPSQRPAWNVYVGPIKLTLLPDPGSSEVKMKTEQWSGWERITLPDSLEKSQDIPVMIIDGVEHRISFGDPHNHSVLSEEGEIDELFRYARYKAALDYVAIVDNDCYEIPMTRTQFSISLTWAQWFNEPSRFVTLPGYEWTLWDRERSDHYNHRTVLFPERARIFWHIDPATPTTADLAHRVEQLGGLLFTQHWNWALTDSDAECGLEVCSAWDYYIDHPEPFHRDLCAGRRLALIGGSDSHRRNPGTCGALTGVWARELSREAIFEALRARRCFATSGSKMVLDFRIDDAPMGSEVTTSGHITVVVRVWGTRPLERLTIMRGWVGSDPLQVSVVHECRLSGMYAEVTWHDDPPPGTSFYYVVAKQAGEDIRYLSNVSIAEGCRAWGSPIWVVRP